MVWSKEIVDSLRGAEAGIVCVTPENQSEPWVLFEAGALASSLGVKSKVCIYLLGMQPTDLKPGPLTLYQATTATEKDTFKLVKSLNSSCGQRGVPEYMLERQFKQYWPDLQAVIDTLSAAEAVAANLLRTSEQVLEEVLAEVRRVAKQNEELIAALRQRTEERAYMTRSHEVQQALAADAGTRLRILAQDRLPVLIPLMERATFVADRDGGYEFLAHDDDAFEQLLKVQSDLDALIREAKISWAITIRRA